MALQAVSAGHRRVGLAPEEIHVAAVEEAQDIFRLPLPEIPNLKRMRAAYEMREVGSVHGKAMAFESVVGGV